MPIAPSLPCRFQGSLLDALQIARRLIPLPLAFLLLVTSGCRPTELETARSYMQLGAIPNPYVLEITCNKKNWSVRYPDEAGRPTGKGTALSASCEIHAPLGRKLVLLLKSSDYVYAMAIPQTQLKEIAVPGLEFRIEFEPTKAATLELVAEQLCGEPDSAVAGRLVIEPPRRFLQWQDRAN